MLERPKMVWVCETIMQLVGDMHELMSNVCMERTERHAIEKEIFDINENLKRLHALLS